MRFDMFVLHGRILVCQMNSVEMRLLLVDAGRFLKILGG